MLSKLNDPYTRFLTPEQFESLAGFAKGTTTVEQEKNAGGLGVQLMADPKTGGVVVMNVVGDGPAGNNGVLEGEVILGLDGERVVGNTAEVVAGR